jgi:predicted ABC-type ATPase
VQAIARVRERVTKGGHHIPAEDIRRRFKRSLVHLTEMYLQLSTRWAIWDNRGMQVKRVAISSVDSIKNVQTLVGL